MTEANPEDRRPLDSISQLGNALCAEKLSADSKVRIVYPKAKCKMLAEEVVLIDSPGEFSLKEILFKMPKRRWYLLININRQSGIDVEADLDEWIDKFCLDSDVFVLVANAESTLMLTEKKFFHKVRNLFI